MSLRATHINGSRRRSRSVMEDGTEGSEGSGAPAPSGSKRVRKNGANGHLRDEGFESPAYLNGTGDHSDEEEENTRRIDIGEGGYQAGAIVRVKLTNFVTYASAEFFPGPNLNMVIGPNGTGKSSLVCAIALGLGYSTKTLGRATAVSEYVKHNEKVAIIEIELQKRKGEPTNHIVEARIIRSEEKIDFRLNRKKVSLQTIKALMKSLSIQIDNLCQFLPQDRVSEFAAMNAVQMLHETQRAAAPDQMLQWHDELKAFRKDQKDLEGSLGNDEELLKNLQNRQESLKREVEQVEQHNAVVRKVQLLKDCVPFVQYRVAKDAFSILREKKKEAERNLRALEAEVEPILQAVNRKEEYQRRIGRALVSREKALVEAENTAARTQSMIEECVEALKDIVDEEKGEKSADDKRKADIEKRKRSIANFERTMREDAVSFDAAFHNDRIRAKNSEKRELNTQLDDTKREIENNRDAGRALLAERETLVLQQVEAESQAGIQMNKISKLSSDTATAWQWIQDNRDKFEKEVYGPPVVTCSVTNPRYATVVESCFNANSWITFTVQTGADHAKLTSHLINELKLREVRVHTVTDTLDSFKHRYQRLSAQQLQQNGLDGWAVDFVDGPEPVLAMLCADMGLASTAVALKESTEEQFQMTTRSGLTKWVAGNTVWSVNSRKEYGKDATSTRSGNVRPARHFTAQPVDDTPARREHAQRVSEINTEFAALKQQQVLSNEKKTQLTGEIAQKETELAAFQQKKNELQKAHGERMALPGKIKREQEAMEEVEAERTKYRKSVTEFKQRKDVNALQKAKWVSQHVENVEQIHHCHEELMEAEIMQIEAASDVEALRFRNADVAQQLEEERQRKTDAQRDADLAKADAQASKRTCEEIMVQYAEDTEASTFFGEHPLETTVEFIEAEIQTEQAALGFIHVNDHGAVRKYKERQDEIEKLQSKVDEASEKLRALSASAAETRRQWEPELDKLISKISDAFSYNFEKIGCAGEVSVHKDDDFDQWSIEIKVKFRENETLQILDAHRQSGGERSVSTVFYLMALQALARSPFRVVDEINQGMDPRNERMVHERMVDIACKEFTSQYFLITPKLLDGLKFDRRMRVLCIASGEGMPKDRGFDVRRIIEKRKLVLAGV